MSMCNVTSYIRMCCLLPVKVLQFLLALFMHSTHVYHMYDHVDFIKVTG